MPQASLRVWAHVHAHARTHAQHTHTRTSLEPEAPFPSAHPNCRAGVDRLLLALLFSFAEKRRGTAALRSHAGILRSCVHVGAGTHLAVLVTQ